MTTFSILAALLVCLALCFVVPPLMWQHVEEGSTFRDDANLALLREQLHELDNDLADGTINEPSYRGARRELEHRVAEEVRADATEKLPVAGSRLQAILLAVAIIAVACGLYLKLGTPRGLDPTVVAGAGKTGQLTRAQAEAMLEKLAQAIKTQPNNAEGWFVLARSYAGMKRYSEAVDAYAHLVALIPDDAELLAGYADALAMTQDKSLLGEPEKLLLRAQTLDPENIKMLLLLGSAAYERHDYEAAISRWEMLLERVPPDSAIRRVTAGRIEDARVRLAASPAAPIHAEATAPPPSTSAVVKGAVTLDPALRGEVSADDTVFIYARAVEGSRFPLAVLRKKVSDLPVDFVLDDSMSMVRGTTLAGHPHVVGARISKTGNATPSSGDLEASMSPVIAGTKNVAIRINTHRR